MKKQQLTISTTEELKAFVNRKDIDIKSAFNVAKSFLKVEAPDNDKNLSCCIVLELIGGTNEPHFNKENIIEWIDKYDKDPYNCVVMFSFK